MKIIKDTMRTSFDKKIRFNQPYCGAYSSRFALVPKALRVAYSLFIVLAEVLSDERFLLIFLCQCFSLESRKFKC